MRTNVYLAARYSRIDELCHYRDRLEAEGYHVTSRWLRGNHRMPSGPHDSTDPARDHDTISRKFALEDATDVFAADVLILFGEPPRTPTRGGRLVEFGIAYARGMHCYLVGPRENVFAYLPLVRHFDTFNKAHAHLNAFVGPRGGLH